ncbi:DUF1987 domain-containing protein, partial [Tenuifilum sp.]|uniref:DUF1987 domain-containing protein n=2 Tax=Tenuifilum sp. TaxID=2760880 RepID=UPI002C038672|nr:DUF1987 domain-containing protein [Tenuifilum sp.]HQG72358.1 DUF1987 domain-containing protein [Tenuifilum sp.]HQI89140.1 DUF1987 domain-containing protein [Tenuifilum sp.]HRR11386.1 DUF1987 domain-containing protein [Tenuifilum sp.]HRS44137.1 DUF1987 domain-containing protein [Tenuifilum sp.]
AMKALRIEAEIDSPEIYFNPDTKVFSISGISHPENAKEFYQQILDWLDEYYEFIKNQEPSKIIVDLNFRYINSTSYKYLRDVLRKISSFRSANFEVEVIWNYHEEDEELLHEGEVLFELPDINLPYKCIPYN